MAVVILRVSILQRPTAISCEEIIRLRAMASSSAQIVAELPLTPRPTAMGITVIRTVLAPRTEKPAGHIRLCIAPHTLRGSPSRPVALATLLDIATILQAMRLHGLIGPR